MTRKEAEKLAIKLGLSTWDQGDDGFGGEDVPDKKAIKILMAYSPNPSPAPEVMGTPEERAAQKMAEAYGWGWEHMGNEAKSTFRKMAKAVLEVFQPDPWVDVKVGLPK